MLIFGVAPAIDPSFKRQDKSFIKAQIVNHFETDLWSIYQDNRLISKKTEYSYDISECSRRLIQNTAYILLA